MTDPLDELFGSSDIRGRHFGVMPVVVEPTLLDPAPFVAEAFQVLLGGHLRPPFIQLVKDGTSADPSLFCSTRYLSNGTYEAADPQSVSRHFAEGHTVVIQSLERWSPAAMAATRRISRVLGTWVDFYVYATPPDARGFDFHFDPQDVFIWQVEGNKVWEVAQPPSGLLGRAHPTDYFAGRMEVNSEASLRVELVPGQALYIPSGWSHSGVASSEGSLHMTLGLVVRQLADAAAEVALKLLDEPDSGASVPMLEASSHRRRAFARKLANALDDYSLAQHSLYLYPELDGGLALLGSLRGWAQEDTRRYIGW